MGKRNGHKHSYKVIYSLRWINSSDLIISEDYQRDEHRPRISQIVSDFDEHIANEPKVSRRDGKYFVFDGHNPNLKRNPNFTSKCTSNPAILSKMLGFCFTSPQ